MARGLNRCEFIGNLGADPELRYTQAGDAVASFNIACSEQWKDRDGNKQEKTEWVKIVAWRQLAEICGQYLVKGKQIWCAGKMQTRQWEDRDGVTRYTTEVVISDMLMLGGGGNGGGGARADDPGVTDDDIPF